MFDQIDREGGPILISYQGMVRIFTFSRLFFFLFSFGLYGDSKDQYKIE